MPVPKKRYTLSKENVDRAPATPGVYALFAGRQLIFYGRALGGVETIRSCLQAHQAGSARVAVAGATHYRRRRCADPATRETELLTSYARSHRGRLPRCNEGAGSTPRGEN
jgi:TPP-dependent trihydroxycyclohexane-1,2-dione (THcHDO) dehydratase